jgi:putative Mn2+ efflux pump MntP
MGLWEWAEKKIRKLTVCDVAVLKFALLTFGAIIGAYFSPFIRGNILPFAAFVLLLFGWLLYRIFRK